MALKTGVRLGDRYELVGRIAVGGMGEVWRGRDTTLQRIVAVKVLRSEFTGDATFVARFRTEARNTAMLSHVNIAQVYDYGEAMAEGEHVAYLVMELIDGEPLSDVLANGRRLSGPQVLDILGQTAAGLGVAHQAGVVHRDVKPANLIIRPDRVVKITDFGISRATDHVPLTSTGMVVGTAQYLSPEQAMGRAVTPASDVYALGVVGYEALAGRRPFDGESSVAVALAHVNQQPAPLPEDVSDPLRDLIGRAMVKDPQRRYRDAEAFAEAIRSVTAGRSLPSRSAPAPARPRSQPSGAVAPRGGKRPTARMPAVQPPRARPPSRPVSYAPPPIAPQPRARPKSRTGQYVSVIVLFALLIAVGLVAVWITHNKDATQAGSGSAAVTTAGAAGTVFIDTNSYRGQPVDEVEAALTALGLHVRTEGLDVAAEALQAAGIENQPFDKNDVVTTDPTQTEVQPGSAVTVYFAKKKYEPGAGNGNGNGNDG
ncbi:MAG: protein kinase [Geodermatophilaceae bacterium]|nr:protein kinase [Geodermatophilaceae bacterium]